MVRLRPAPHSRTPILAYTLKITPEAHFINWQQDPFGNYLARLVFPETTREFSVDVEVIADMTVINPFDYFIEEGAFHWPFDYDPALKRELAPYLETEPAGERLAAVPREQSPQPSGTRAPVHPETSPPPAAQKHRAHRPKPAAAPSRWCSS